MSDDQNRLWLAKYLMKINRPRNRVWSNYPDKAGDRVQQSYLDHAEVILLYLSEHRVKNRVKNKAEGVEAFDMVVEKQWDALAPLPDSDGRFITREELQMAMDYAVLASRLAPPTPDAENTLTLDITDVNAAEKDHAQSKDNNEG